MTTSGGNGRSRFERELRGPADVDDAQMLTLGEDGARSWRRPPRDSRTPRPPRVSAAVEAAVAAGAGLLVLPGLGQLQRQVLVRSEGLFVVGILLSVGAAFVAAAALHRWLGGGRRRDAVAVGLVTAALAGTAWGAIAIAGGWQLSEYLPPRTVLEAIALATVVVGVRGDGVGARLAGAVAGVATAVTVVSALQSGWPLLTTYLSAPAPSTAVPAPDEVSEEAPPTEQEVVPPEAPAGPTFGDLCHPDELEMTSSTPVPGGNDVAATLTATNIGGRDCRVEAWPTVHVLSDGEDLALNVLPRDSAPGGEHVDAESVMLARGASARTHVWWPSWGAAADLDADQQVWVGVGGGTEVVDLAPGDRWDVVRSAEAYVTPWEPATP